MVDSTRGQTCVWQIKLCDPFNTGHSWAH